MSKQGVNITIQDGGLGQSVPGQGPTFIVIGCSSAGTAYQPYTSTNPNAFPTQFGYGEAPDLAAYITAETGNPVTMVKTATVTSGSWSNSGTCYTGSTNTSTSVVTLTNTGTNSPWDSAYLVISVLAGGTIATNGIQLGISVDGGASTYATVNLGTNTTSSAILTVWGTTIVFAAGTLVTGDSFWAVATPPLWNDSGVQSALTATLSVNGVTFQNVFIAGQASASDVTAFDGYMTTRQTNKRFNRMLTGCRDALWGGASTETEATWMTSIETAFSTTTSLTVGVCAGHYRQISPITSAQMRRNLLWSAAARNAGVGIAVDLGEVDLGGLPNLVLPPQNDSFGSGGAGQFFYHDEALTPGLDAARFTSAWKIAGEAGLFIMNPNLMAPPGSDFNWLQHGQVIDAMAVIMYGYFVKQLSRGVRVNAKTGFILPQDADRFQKQCNSLFVQNGTPGLKTAGDVSAAACVVATNDNILSTATLTVTGEIVPLGYLKAINITLLFLNPAVVAVSLAA
jgi:hypothetical protein